MKKDQTAYDLLEKNVLNSETNIKEIEKNIEQCKEEINELVSYMQEYRLVYNLAKTTNLFAPDKENTQANDFMKEILEEGLSRRGFKGIDDFFEIIAEKKQQVEDLKDKLEDLNKDLEENKNSLSIQREQFVGHDMVGEYIEEESISRVKEENKKLEEEYYRLQGIKETGDYSRYDKYLGEDPEIAFMKRIISTTRTNVTNSKLSEPERQYWAEYLDEKQSELNQRYESRFEDLLAQKYSEIEKNNRVVDELKVLAKENRDSKNFDPFNEPKKKEKSEHVKSGKKEVGTYVEFNNEFEPLVEKKDSLFGRFKNWLKRITKNKIEPIIVNTKERAQQIIKKDREDLKNEEVDMGDLHEKYSELEDDYKVRFTLDKDGKVTPENKEHETEKAKEKDEKIKQKEVEEETKEEIKAPELEANENTMNSQDYFKIRKSKVVESEINKRIEEARKRVEKREQVSKENDVER